MSNEALIDLYEFCYGVRSKVPAGSYRVRVEDIDLDSVSPHDPVLRVFLETIDAEHPGLTLVDSIRFGDRAGSRSRAFNEAVGLSPLGHDLLSDPPLCIGCELEVDVYLGEPHRGRAPVIVQTYSVAPEPTGCTASKH